MAVATDEDTIESQGESIDPHAPAASTHAATASEGIAAADQDREGPTSVMASPGTSPSGPAVGVPPGIVETPSPPNGAQVAEPVPSTVTRQASAPSDDIVYTPFALSIGDGFKFGCGLVLAAFVTAMMLALIAAIAFLVASLAGINVPIGAIGT
ncbi:MAG TPA: hypothetical protein VHX16_16390 [Chloroflexota bacterium]|jgi:hypothetical protein|nr:hypothetical protein [Chloroflexota bacterium]